MAALRVRTTPAAGGKLFGMMVEGSRGFKARKSTCCCCARLHTATSAAPEKVTNPARGVEEVEVIAEAKAVRPEEACAADMRVSGRAWE